MESEVPTLDETEKSYLMGREEGEKIGFERAQKELFHHTQLLQKMSEAFLEKKSLLESLRPEIIEFAIAICEKVIRSELSQKEKFAKLIDRYLAIATYSHRDERVILFLSPEDLFMVESYLKSMELKKDIITKISFLSDTTLLRGDIRIETRSTVLNATISRELEDLRSKVLNQ